MSGTSLEKSQWMYLM